METYDSAIQLFTTDLLGHQVILTVVDLILITDGVQHISIMQIHYLAYLVR